MLWHPDPVVRRLQWARAVRSIAQGIAVVDVSLYLAALHWSAVAIGSVLAGAAIVGGAMIAAVGPLSDRWGRRPFLLVYDALAVAGALVLATSRATAPVAAAILITGFGRGQNGSAGPFTPAEQAWLAHRLPSGERGVVFSQNNALAFLGMGVGALLGGLPHWWSQALPGAARFAPVFGLVALLSSLVWIILWKTPEDRRRQNRAPAPPTLVQRENHDLARLAVVNLFNGLAQGFTGPLIAYWFATRYHATTAAVGAALAGSFFATAGAAWLAGQLSRSQGAVRVVVWLQAISAAMVLLLPWMPSLTSAAALNILRVALGRGGQGARAAVSASLTRDTRRGFALSVNSLAFRVSSAAGPPMAGWLWEAGWAAGPFAATALLQGMAVILYWQWFRHRDVRPAASAYAAGDTP